jgi:serine/threonine-protein kinase
VREGEHGNAAYEIVEGRCAAFQLEGGVEVQLRVMGVGEVFGETAIFSDNPTRTASVRAVSDVVLRVVTREALSNAVGLNSWMGAFVRTLAERFREVDQTARSQRLGPQGQ